jgi:hypothetical protein
LLYWWRKTEHLENNKQVIDKLVHTYTIHCRKIKKIFVQALETGRKASMAQTFLGACFAESAN